MNEALEKIIQNALNYYEKHKNFYDPVREHNTITYLQKMINEKHSIESLELFQKHLLMHHQWNQNPRQLTPTDTCILDVLLESKNFQWYVGINAAPNRQWYNLIVDTINCTENIELLAEPKALANFNAITINGGKYAQVIALALNQLNQAGPLTKAQAQTNFNTIIASGEQYALESPSLKNWHNQFFSHDAKSTLGKRRRSLSL